MGVGVEWCGVGVEWCGCVCGGDGLQHILVSKIDL